MTSYITSSLASTEQAINSIASDPSSPLHPSLNSIKINSTALVAQFQSQLIRILNDEVDTLNIIYQDPDKLQESAHLLLYILDGMKYFDERKINRVEMKSLLDRLKNPVTVITAQANALEGRVHEAAMEQMEKK